VKIIPTPIYAFRISRCTFPTRAICEKLSKNPLDRVFRKGPKPVFLAAFPFGSDLQCRLSAGNVHNSG
jgi:hypothetical protein